MVSGQEIHGGCWFTLSSVNQQPPVHHERWMVSGQETVFFFGVEFQFPG